MAVFYTSSSWYIPVTGIIQEGSVAHLSVTRLDVSVIAARLDSLLPHASMCLCYCVPSNPSQVKIQEDLFSFGSLSVQPSVAARPAPSAAASSFNKHFGALTGSGDAMNGTAHQAAAPMSMVGMMQQRQPAPMHMNMGATTAAQPGAGSFSYVPGTSCLYLYILDLTMLDTRTRTVLHVQRICTAPFILSGATE